MRSAQRIRWGVWAVLCVCGALFAVVFALLFGYDDPAQRLEGQPVWATAQALVAVLAAGAAIGACICRRPNRGLAVGGRRPGVAGAVHLGLIAPSLRSRAALDVSSAL